MKKPIYEIIVNRDGGFSVHNTKTNKTVSTHLFISEAQEVAKDLEENAEMTTQSQHTPNGIVEVFYSDFRGHYGFDVFPSKEYQEANRAERFDCVVNAFDTKHEALKAAEIYAENRGMKVRVA